MTIIKRAFTLIELLVVIAIIAILAAILFPVFARAKAAAKSSADLSNNKQINLAIIQYATDNNDMYSRNWFGGDVFRTYSVAADPNTYHWEDAVFPYVKSADIFRSPVADIVAGHAEYITRDQIPTRGFDGGRWTDYWGSYAVNAAYWGTGNQYEPLGCSTFGKDGGTPRSSTSIDDVAGTVLLVNGNGSFQFDWPNIGSQPTKVVGTGNSQSLSWGDNSYDLYKTKEGAIIFPNNGRTNTGFPDGHAKSVTPGQMLKKNTDPNTATYGALSMFTAEQD